MSQRSIELIVQGDDQSNDTIGFYSVTVLIGVFLDATIKISRNQGAHTAEPLLTWIT